MKKVLILSLALFFTNVTFAQRILTRSGEIKFDASMPNLVEIAGKSNTVSAILDENAASLMSDIGLSGVTLKQGTFISVAEGKFITSIMTVHLMFWAVLVIIGSFFRGPGFNFTFPWRDGIFFEL